MGQQASTLSRRATVDRAAERPARGARARLDTATRALGIATAVAMPAMLALGFLDVPIINQSVRWWRTLHPAPIVERANPALPPAMLQTMAVALVAFALLYAYLLAQRLRVERLRAEVGELQQRALFED